MSLKIVTMPMAIMIMVMPLMMMATPTTDDDGGCGQVDGYGDDEEVSRNTQRGGGS